MIGRDLCKTKTKSHHEPLFVLLSFPFSLVVSHPRMDNFHNQKESNAGDTQNQGSLTSRSSFFCCSSMSFLFFFQKQEGSSRKGKQQVKVVVVPLARFITNHIRGEDYTCRWSLFTYAIIIILIFFFRALPVCRDFPALRNLVLSFFKEKGGRILSLKPVILMPVEEVTRKRGAKSSTALFSAYRSWVCILIVR